MTLVKKPRWLEDYPEIESCLQGFINKLEIQPAKERTRKKIPYAINRKNFPSLWQQTTESDYQWQLIRDLESDYGICEIRFNKKRNPLDPEFHNASIQIFCDAEKTIRNWLNRPYEEPLLKQWKEVVKQQESLFPGTIERLQSRIFNIQGKSTKEVVRAFIVLGEYLEKFLTLRQLSARCFWGMSKILDNQEDLVLSLYPGMNIKPRPLIISLHIPDNATACLFIENHDTYVNALQGDIPITKHQVLVYCSGFLGSANRIRTSGSVVFHWSSGSTSSKKQSFENWWLHQSGSNLPVFFWGDLDYSGMAILAALKKVFPEIKAWQPGYTKMLEALDEKMAHEVDVSGKNNQEDPVTTGCDYADKILLPTLRLLFVDQEVV